MKRQNSFVFYKILKITGVIEKKSLLCNEIFKELTDFYLDFNVWLPL